ncbi:MAG TPA: class I SAM-dependent methyltransferase [Pyrinomonadaceae bacterium]|jgi:SAM-dependent methyltransferase
MIRALRAGRRWAYLSLAPFDYFWRAINGRRELPPLHLRRYVGPLRSFETSGAEFMAYLRLLCRLQPHERVLDIGCGCGQMALQLLDYLGPEGVYVGLDIHRPSIEWCLRNIGSKRPNFKFQYLDVKSQAYNPRGRHMADGFRFPFKDRAFDLVLLKSLLTHMRREEVDNYLKETSRLLSDNGRCLATLFLLNERQRERAAQGLNQLDFAFGDDACRYVYKNSPESAIAYDESFVMGLLEKHGLALTEPILYGRWSGLCEGLSYQDILLLEKR